MSTAEGTRVGGTAASDLVAATANRLRGVGSSVSPSRRPAEFHRRLPGYAPSRLVDARSVAESIGVGRLLVKDESQRLGLPSFKILGASWAVYRTLEERRGEPFDHWNDIEELARQVAVLGSITLVAATDGNHGRAVARMARLLGLSAHIFVPADMSAARRKAVSEEGALVTVVDGTYDDTVLRAAEEATDSQLVISDTSWPGYERVPSWIIDGYSTIFWEIDQQIDDGSLPAPDVVLIQIGVGAFAAAASRHYRRGDLPDQPVLVGVEPEAADCLRASIEAESLVTLSGPQPSVMAGLNCGTPSMIAWPTLSSGFDSFVTITDNATRSGMRDLATVGVVSGETGAAGVGALRALAASPGLPGAVLDGTTSVLVVSTEGATDPAAYRRVVSPGSPPPDGR